MLSPHERLANAIVLQAVADYRKVSRWLCTHRPVSETDEYLFRYQNKHIAQKNLERFFVGEWFTVLTKLDGPLLLKRLEAEYDSQRIPPSSVSPE